MSRTARRWRKSARAQQRGLKVYGETCPQYLVLTDEGPRRPQHGGRQVCLLAAAARQGEPAGVLGGHAAGRVLAVLVRPLPVPLRRSARQAGAEGPHVVPLGAERHSRRRDAAADPVLRGRRQGPHLAQRIRRADLDQPRQDLRPLSEERHDRGRRRRRHRDLGPEPRGHDLAVADAWRLRLHAL